MKKIGFASFLLTLLFLTSWNCSIFQSEQSKTVKKIEEYMTRLEKTGFSGSLLVAKNNKIWLARGYGFANYEKKIPFTENTVSTIGSITKQFTAAAILKLQEQGKLSVKDPINKYFSDVPEDKQKITLHHLLTHSAGFPGAIGEDFEKIDRDKFIRRAMETPLLFQPGTSYKYSNVGYSLLGAIIEIVSGENYETYLRKNLFAPAGLTRTGYRLPHWIPDSLAHGYRRGSDWGTLLDHPQAPDGPYWNLRANGGILSTVKDLYKWHLALKGNAVLSDSSKWLYYYPHVREGENAESYYGYGWALFTTNRGTKLIAHDGGNTIFAADFRRYVDENVVIIAMSNIAGKPAFRITGDIACIVFNEPYDLPPEKEEILSLNQLQKSPIGVHALALLTIYRIKNKDATQALIEQHFAPDFLKRVTMERLLKMIENDRRKIGNVLLQKITKTGDNRLTLKVQSKSTGEWWEIALKFEKKTPHRINGIGVTDTMPE
ncbi:MAG: beta-lactamase family protein [Calditrichaeota bacterium]|nr:beta-lactamase family protein [Calditrichota bacterium]